MRTSPVVFPHANFESLLSAITREWIGGGKSPVPQPVVIPSIPFSDYLQLRIAHRFGVCMGIDFLTSQDFIHRATGPQVENAWSDRQLAWRILPFVGEYAPKLGVKDPSPRDRFALAGLIGDQFDQYGHFRPEIIRSWVGNRPVLKAGATGDDGADEAWQRELWRKLREVADGPHPVEQFEALKGDAAFRKRLVALFPRLLVLGSGVIDPLLVQMLELLADSGGTVEIHVLLPSLEFLGDLRMRQALPTLEQDPEEIAVGSTHPLLESMGRHAVGTFLLLGQLDDQYTHWPEAGNSPRIEGRLLRRLQSDIRSLREPALEAPIAEDHSIRVHSCFGARREMEILRDEILRAFHDLPDLKPEEIHIVAPSLETYAPLASAVLESGPSPLAIRLMESPAGDRDPVIEAVLGLLEMAKGGRFEASWLMELVQLEAVQNVLGVSGDDRAVEQLRQWIRASGVTRGIGHHDGRAGTWGFARDRLVAGRFFGPEETVKYPDGTFVLPVAAELAVDEELSRRFIGWFLALEATMREWDTMAPASAWATRINHVCVTVAGGDDEAMVAVQPHLAFLRIVGTAEPVDAATISDWLEAGSKESGRGSRVSGRTPFGRLKQLQNIPCRVLAMVGMEDGAFPGQTRPPAWDLLRKSPRVWDRNARIDDRQLFLDALLTPSDRLIITASTRNVRTKKTEPFSSCVDELLRVTSRMGAPRESLVVEHRLQPFAPDYFQASSPAPRSFNAESARVANELETKTEGALLPLGDVADGPTPFAPAAISLGQLITFWKDPAKAFLRAQGIAIPGDEEDDESLDRAAITLGPLEEWGLKAAVIAQVSSASGALDRTEAFLRANRGLPPGHLGASIWTASRDASEPLGLGVKAVLGERVAMEFTLAEGGRVTGEIQRTKSGEHLLAFRPLEFKTARDFFDPWICAVFAAACGHPAPTDLLDPTSPKIPREFPAIAPDVAKTILASLADGFLEGQHRPLCYASATSDVLARALEKGGAVDEAVSIAADEWGKEAGGFGPGGEGMKPSARWAWRDRDPFEDPDAWRDWAERIASPLRAWGGIK